MDMEISRLIDALVNNMIARESIESEEAELGREMAFRLRYFSASQVNAVVAALQSAIEAKRGKPVSIVDIALTIDRVTTLYTPFESGDEP